MWETLAPWLAQSGVTGVIAWVFYRLHLAAVSAERRRADDWRAAWEAADKRANLREEQISKLLSRAKELP